MSFISTSLPTLRASLADRLATGIAYTISPLVLPLPLIGLVLGHFGASPGEIVGQMVVAFLFFGLVPLLYLVWLVQQARVHSIEVRDRTLRTKPFLVGTGSAVVGAALAFNLGTTAVPLVVALLGCIVVNSALLMVVTWRWKISIHAAAVAGFVSMLLFVSLAPWTNVAVPLLHPAAVFILAPLIPLIMWARVRTGAHTPGQVWAGALFGLGAQALELLFLWQLGAFVGL